MAVAAGKSKLVGGVFGYSPGRAVRAPSPPFLRAGDELFLNARSAFHGLLDSLRPPSVWLPSFLCPVLSVVAGAFLRVRYYDPAILSREPPECLSDVNIGDVVVFIDYFGFPSPRDWLSQARACGAIVVEDACQALLTRDVGQKSDFLLFSPRKFLGVVDGGILSARGDRALPAIDWQPAPDEWGDLLLAAAGQRAEFDRAGGDRTWFELYQRAEAAAPIGPHRMSRRSQTGLLTQFDYTKIAERRCENYRALAEMLPEFALLPSLDEGVVPLGFPAVFFNRDQVRAHLFADEIYPPVHWQIEGTVPSSHQASHLLAKRILTLPCDQRYDVSTMERMADRVKGVAESCEAT